MTSDGDPRPSVESLGGYIAGAAIGRGGMGTVYEAVHPTLGKRVALKVIKGSLAGDPVARERFVREARAIAMVSHPNVVDVFDLGIDDERAFIVMELLEGETLEARLARQGRLAVTQALDLFLPLISAVAAIHDTGVVHRDLKPGNVMLARRGRFAIEPVVLDFGISRAADTSGEEALTEPHLLVGTLPYLSPEQLRDARAAGPHSDQYALAVMLYECVTGRKPFTGADRYELMHAVMSAQIVAPSEVAADIPTALDTILLRALARRAEARFPSMRAFGGALLSAADRSAWRRWANEFVGIDPAADAEPSSDTAQDVRTPLEVTARVPRRARWLGVASGVVALGAAFWLVRPQVKPEPTSSAVVMVPPVPIVGVQTSPTPHHQPPPQAADRAPAEASTEAKPVRAKRRARVASEDAPRPTGESRSYGKPAESAQAEDAIDPFAPVR